MNHDYDPPQMPLRGLVYGLIFSVAFFWAPIALIAWLVWIR